jgi:hypothetical protein
MRGGLAGIQADDLGNHPRRPVAATTALKNL